MNPVYADSMESTPKNGIGKAGALLDIWANPVGDAMGRMKTMFVRDVPGHAKVNLVVDV